MMLSRRDFMRLAGLVAAGAALSGCAPLHARLANLVLPESGELPSGSAADFVALNRLTFGPRIEERQRVAEIGLEAWIEEQLRPESLDDWGTELRLRPLDTLSMKANDLFDLSDKLFDGQDRTTVPGQLRQATLLRQVYSRRQLHEVMVEFWTDHFNISVDKGDCWFLKTVDDRDVIRPHALGRFRDLLGASAHSPAMLVYLDNQSSHAGAPNENYARELMELHTLGLDGGYSQQDVMELARCLTGWTVKEHFWRGDFAFKPDLHDDGVKTVLGMTIEPEGQAEAERVLDVLATHSSTARFIATKLVCRFIADDPPAWLVERAADTFGRTDGDIQAVLRTILLDGLAYAQPKFKRPVQFIASVLRMLNARTDCDEPLNKTLLRMGQPPFAWPTPDGFPDQAGPWQGNLMPRWQFAFELVQNDIAGTKIDLAALTAASGAGTPAGVVDHLSALLLGAPLEAAKRDELLTALQTSGAEESHLPAIVTAGLLASPAFQWR